ncbi:MAG: site-specific DNA-methyltransferase [Desulfovibrio sp.]|nr:site-specific DNA-methyltransferase [Desulfovibrio sp.]
MIKVSLSDHITLFHGDALSVLTTLAPASVGAVLTDPPYSSGGLSMGARQANPHSKYKLSAQYATMLGDAKDQRSWTMWCTLWLSECWRIAREGAPLMVFTDWRQLPALTDAIQAAGWMWRGVVTWDKRSGRPMLGRFRQQCEYVVFGTKGRFDAPSRACLPGVYAHSVNPARKVHLTSKPVELIVDLLKVTRKDADVLDPFMGGGSVGEACVATGRGYIGIELSPEYFEVSRARLETCMARDSHE